ncbi:cupin domain-containing protein [Serratia sp. CY68801]|uniref:cupin domain-containing protein n=1 Tax=Serratia sp. CY68801 TaxID=3383668 RepID=UPI003F9ED65F
MDPLSQLLMLNDMRGYVARDCHFSGEWRSPHAAGEWSQIRWHMVLAGSCRLEIPGGRPVPLEHGSLLFLPHNSAHRLLPERADSATHLLCGVQILPHSASPLLASLPECLLFNSRQQGRLIAREII